VTDSPRGGADRFQGRFYRAAAALIPAGSKVLVALSGGIDSVLLLHELRRLAPVHGWSLVAAHLDHAMRPSSAGDAAWVAGLCRAWEIPLVSERLPDAPRGETAARQARHAFLRRVAESEGCALIATGHHADDQAETVLFRAIRGTGVRGLAGMAPRTPGGVVRPLLGFPRAAIRRHARRIGLRFREDPTNLALGAARNRLRHRVIPLLEQEVNPAARRNLARLAANAAEEREALEVLLRPYLDETVRRDGHDVVVDRDRVRGYPAPLASLVVREALRRAGHRASRAGTEATVAFISNAPSGRCMPLGDGLQLCLEFGAARLGRGAAAGEDRPLRIDRPAGDEPGGGVAVVGGRTFRARWTIERSEERAGAGDGERLDLEALRFPLTLRGWLPGDRIAMAGGTRKLKKVFGERRVPRSERGRLPVLADAAGEVVLVAGLVRTVRAAPRAGADALVVFIQDD
jgi:tRNA(Ile)-lysidine synthase